jgi:hypothetical protein
MDASNKKLVNEEFYPACTAYFTALRRKGKTDYGFEDEFYYTMPAISKIR